jgi:hypothetical protein
MKNEKWKMKEQLNVEVDDSATIKATMVTRVTTVAIQALNLLPT